MCFIKNANSKPTVSVEDNAVKWHILDFQSGESNK